MNKLTLLTKGIFIENPLFVMTIGLCPALLIANTTKLGFVFGACTLVVLLCSTIVMSVLKSFITDKTEIIYIVILAAGFTTLEAVIMKGEFPLSYEEMGLYMPLVAISCVIFETLTFFPRNHTFIEANLNSLGIGIGYLWAITLVGAVREFLSEGSIWGKEFFVVAESGGFFMILPGGLIVLGVLIALVNKINRRIKMRGKGLWQ